LAFYSPNQVVLLNLTRCPDDDVILILDSFWVTIGNLLAVKSVPNAPVTDGTLLDVAAEALVKETLVAL